MLDVEHFEFVKVTEVMDQLGNLLNLQRLQKIRFSILHYLEGAQSKVENRFDSNLRRVLKETYDLLEGVKVEIESIQGNILKLLKSKTLKKLVARPVSKSKRPSAAQGR